MADKPIDKKEIEELRRLMKLLDEEINAVDFDNLIKSGAGAKTLLNSLRKDAEEFTSDISYAAEGFRKVVEEINNTNEGVKLANKSFNKLADIADKIKYHQQDISKLTLKEVQTLQKQTGQQKTRLDTSNNLLLSIIDQINHTITQQDIELDFLIKKKNLSDDEIERLRELEKQQEKSIKNLSKTEAAQRNIQGILKDQDALFGGLTVTLDKINRELEEEKKKLGLTGAILEGFNKIPFLNGIIDTNAALDAAKEKIKDGGNNFQVMSAAVNTVGKQITAHLTDPLFIVGFLVTELIATFKSVDSAIGNLAKGFDMSYNSATNLRMELTDIANLSGDVAVTTKGLQESMMAVGNSLGSNAMLNKEDLVTFTKLREQAGYTNDELVGIQKLTLATGGNLEDNAKSFLGTVAVMNAQNKLTINAKQLLKEVANVSDSIKLSIGGTTEKLAEAAFKAKQFGINLAQADQISSSLLDFESSINNEISAELITGKDLNLEKARLLALNGDIAGAGAEILKQVGGTAEFTKMNRIQQEALAKAVGLSRDDLAKSLVDREALAKLGAKEGQSAQDAYNAAVAKYGVEKAKNMLGDEALANQFQQQSVQERFAQSIEKLKELFVSLVEPLMPVFDVFADIMGIVGPIVGVLGTMIKYAVDFGKYLLIPLGIMKGFQLIMTGIAATQVFINGLTVKDNVSKATGNVLLGIGNFLTAGIFSTKTKQGVLEVLSNNNLYTGNLLQGLRNAMVNQSLGVQIRIYAMYLKEKAILIAGNVLRFIRNTLGLTEIGIQSTSNKVAGKGLMVKVGQMIASMFKAGAEAPFPANLILPFVFGAIAGGFGGALISKYMGDGNFPAKGQGPDRTITSKGTMYKPAADDNIYVTPQKMVAVGNASSKGNGGADNYTSAKNQFPQQQLPSTTNVIVQNNPVMLKNIIDNYEKQRVTIA